jgi:DNA invertase Pin-like site-specific DNA recombinase
VFEQNLEAHLEAQERAIRELTTARGWHLLEVYSDRTAGTKGRWPGLDALLTTARKKKFQVLVVDRLALLARSLPQVVKLLTDLHTLNIYCVSIKERIDLVSPVGRVMLGALSVLHAVERELASERIVAGMAHAREGKTRSGLPVGRPKLVFDRQRACDMREAGDGWDAIAIRLGVSVSTLWRHARRGKLGKIVPTAEGPASR